jgi:hypothetical protein
MKTDEKFGADWSEEGGAALKHWGASGECEEKADRPKED